MLQQAMPIRLSELIAAPVGRYAASVGPPGRQRMHSATTAGKRAAPGGDAVSHE